MSRVQISASLSFHVSSAEFKLSMIQFPAGHLLSEKMRERPIWTLPLLENRNSGCDKVKDFLGKGNHEAARQGEETLRTLGRVVALEGEADLHHAPAQQDEADGADQGKDEVGQVVHHAQRIAGGKSRGGEATGAQHHSDIAGKAEAPLFPKRQGVCGLAVFSVLFQGNKFTQRFLQKHSSSSKCIVMV